MIGALPEGGVAILSDVDWDEYDALLSELDDYCGIRLSYANKTLELLRPTLEQERFAGLFPHFILVLAQASGQKFFGARTTTLRRKACEKGKEPDDCYYFRDRLALTSTRELDLTVDHPPDLALEIDFTHSSLIKLDIYAGIGVPELWRYHHQGMNFYRLTAGEYMEIKRSDLFPFLTPSVLHTYLRRGVQTDFVEATANFRKWVHTHKS